MLFLSRCRWALICTILTMATPSFRPALLPGEEPRTLTRTSSWTTVFAEEEIKLQVKSTVTPPVKGRLLWGLSSGERLNLFKGEVAAEGELSEFTIKFPSVVPGVVLTTQLIVHLYREGEREPIASHETPIHVFPRDPFANRRETLKKLAIKLYDPTGHTAQVLTAAKLPYQSINNVAEIAETKDGLLLIGEGVSFRDDRSLPELLTRAAGRGVPVLCLAPAAGEFELPRSGDDAVRSMSFQKNSFVHHLDKRLDDAQWMTQPAVARQSLQLSGRGAGIVLEVSAGNDGWQWLEMQVAPPGKTTAAAPAKLVLMSLPVIEHWEAGPTPRFLFSRLIDYIAPAQPLLEKADVP